MKVIILHYHLNPGGVTSVIGSQIRALKAADPALQVVVLCGNNTLSREVAGLEAITDASLNYWDPAIAKSPQTEASQVISFIKKHVTDGCILHCHNANLGKNPALALAIHKLAGEGYAVANHCHDFAEDRTEIFNSLLRYFSHHTKIPLQQVLYPDFPGCDFIVLNSCDRERMISMGIRAGKVHLMPNPVSLPGKSGALDRHSRERLCRALGMDASRKICTYPVRAIRRKNLGEFLLFAILYGHEYNFVVTQAPKNPSEIPGYNRWREFSATNRLNVKFEAGDVVPYEELIRISDFCITTSMKEGFGMVFLEPWLAGTPVIGRDLPCTTKDLVKKGLLLQGLYREIRVDTKTGKEDFKDLEVDEQETYLEDLLNSGKQEVLLKANPFLAAVFNPVSHEIMAHNRRIIKRKFSVAKYGKRLLALYKKISG